MKYSTKFIHGDSDCTIISDSKEALETAKDKLISDKRIIEQFIKNHPGWEESLIPIRTINAPEIIELLEIAAEESNVGPMAAIAGVLADRMADEMKKKHHTKINVVENGGEIIIDSKEDIIIALYVLTTALKGKIGFRFRGDSKKLAVATSSGQFGHAMSLGEADAVVVFADNAGLADAAATKICNEVTGMNHQKAITQGLQIMDEIQGVQGVFISRGGLVGQKGKIPELIRLNDENNAILQKKLKK